MIGRFAMSDGRTKLDQLAEVARERAIHTTGPLYCIRCDYDIRGLGAGDCPECGYSFNPAISGTVSRFTRRERFWRRWESSVTWGFAGAAIIAILWFGGLKSLFAFGPIVLMLFAALSIFRSGVMIKRQGRQRKLKTFTWPRRRY
jgi:hypothetical protein